MYSSQYAQQYEMEVILKSYDLDERRMLFLPGNHQATLKFTVELWVQTANDAIQRNGSFAVALSGGSTPKAIFKELVANHQKSLDWSKVLLFWSDERSVPPDHPDSNYHMAMKEGGLERLGIPENQIFRMVAEKKIEENAVVYEKLIKEHVKDCRFDLIMLGMGDDGHTASLFPHTEALKIKGKLVAANHVPQKDTWRMTFTYECINQAHAICIYVLGANKSEILEKVLLSPLKRETYPSQGIGTEQNKAHWIIDEEASKNILMSLK